ncbi:hypothetical protein K523DRAFT_21292 [Schizophyllum commune Tattone D]|nr:hypothetical protein K523DRAFT_21292 [Schizophyllum commune Tattone D]
MTLENDHNNLLLRPRHDIPPRRLDERWSSTTGRALVVDDCRPRRVLTTEDRRRGGRTDYLPGARTQHFRCVPPSSRAMWCRLVGCGFVDRCLLGRQRSHSLLGRAVLACCYRVSVNDLSLHVPRLHICLRACFFCLPTTVPLSTRVLFSAVPSPSQCPCHLPQSALGSTSPRLITVQYRFVPFARVYI